MSAPGMQTPSTRHVANPLTSIGGPLYGQLAPPSPEGGGGEASPPGVGEPGDDDDVEGGVSSAGAGGAVESSSCGSVAAGFDAHATIATVASTASVFMVGLLVMPLGAGGSGALWEMELRVRRATRRRVRSDG